jgi:hypothetical protein
MKTLSHLLTKYFIFISSGFQFMTKIARALKSYSFQGFAVCSMKCKDCVGPRYVILFIHLLFSVSLAEWCNGLLC